MFGGCIVVNAVTRIEILISAPAKDMVVYKTHTTEGLRKNLLLLNRRIESVLVGTFSHAYEYIAFCVIVSAFASPIGLVAIHLHPSSASYG